MRYLSVLSIFAVFALWGCSGDEVATNVNTPFSTGFCQAGQVRTADGRCLDQFGCPAGEGFNGTTCEPGTQVGSEQVFNSPFPSAYGNSLQITSRNGFEHFLETVGGVCDFSGFFFINFFGPDPFDCDSYSHNGFITLEFYPQVNPFFLTGNAAAPVPAYITIGAGSNSPADGLFGSSGHVTVPLNMTALPINDHAGFEVRSSGGYFSGSNSDVTVRVEDGNFGTDQNFQVIINHNGSEFARAFVNLM